MSAPCTNLGLMTSKFGRRVTKPRSDDDSGLDNTAAARPDGIIYTWTVQEETHGLSHCEKLEEKC